MEFDSHIIWNIILTLVILPLGWWIRTSHDEIRRQDILLNKTREEIARDYVSKRELDQDLARILNAIERLDEKLTMNRQEASLQRRDKNKERLRKEVLLEELTSQLGGLGHTEDQITQESLAVTNLILEIYKDLGEVIQYKVLQDSKK